MPRHLTFAGLSLREQPMLLLSSVFILGLLASTRIPPNLRLLSAILLSLWLMIGFAFLFRWRFVALLLIAGFFSAGILIGMLDRMGLANDRIKWQIESGAIKADEPVSIEGLLLSPPELAPDRLYLVVEVATLTRRLMTVRVRGQVQLVVPFKDAQERREYDALGLDYHQRVRVLCHISRPAGYQNPGATSLRTVLDQRGHDATALIKSPLLIEVLEKQSTRDLRGHLYRMRASAIHSLLKKVKQPVAGLLVAALLGNDNFLDQRLAESFRTGGTYHLLVISGLHIALIAGTVLALLRLLVSSNLLRTALTLAVIWAFAIMVGAQPAVTRAGAALSLALTAQLLVRRQMAPNALGTVAIVLLVWRPADIFNPGFHLSFLTVLAIALITGPLYERMRSTGEWTPGEITPYPPNASRVLRRLSELIFWSPVRFKQQMSESRLRYRLDKTAIPGVLRLDLVWLRRAFFGTLLTTVGIQTILLPLMILYFHRVSFVAPVTNVVEALLIFILMLAGCLFLCVNLVDERLGDAARFAVEGTGELVIRLTQALDKIPLASTRVPDFAHWSVFVYGSYFVFVAWIAYVVSRWNPLSLSPFVERSRVKIRRTAGFIALACWALLMWVIVAYPFAHRFERGRLTLTMLDVGQGDSLLIAFPRGSLLLLDAGGKLVFAREDDGQPSDFVEDRQGIGEMAIAPFLWRFGVKRLDLIAATHSDADHVQGFDDIVRDFKIGRALAGPRLSHEAMHSPFPARMFTPGTERLVVKRGDSFEIDGVRIDVLAPFPELLTPQFSANDRSLVMRLSFGGRRFLLTGDIESRTEQLLVASGDDLKCDVLKVAHHGSRTSSTTGFLDRSQPAYALISAASPSPFGHPHPEVLDRLAQRRIHVLQTGSCGAITLSTNGEDLRHETFVRCE